MSNLTPNISGQQLDLIKSTIAKNATDDELKLFLYRANSMGLDPLKPGMIHFVKYGNGPGTIVVGIDGFRAKASATGKHSGTKRGVIRDDKGLCIGAWCEVYRSDWLQPAREEVSLREYDTGKGPWAKMPETMLKKVAEAAALRMAFPDELGGVYSKEEMDQAEATEPRTVHQIVNSPIARAPKPISAPKTPGEHIIRIGKKYVGQMIKDVHRDDLSGFVKWINQAADARFRESEDTREFLHYAESYLAEPNNSSDFMDITDDFDSDLDHALRSKIEDDRS